MWNIICKQKQLILSSLLSYNIPRSQVWLSFFVFDVWIKAGATEITCLGTKQAIACYVEMRISQPASFLNETIVSSSSVPSHNIFMLHSDIMNTDLGNYIYDSLRALTNRFTEQALCSPYSSLHLCNGLETQFKIMAVCVFQYETISPVIL